MTQISEEKVRERAYYIWEREGRPQGRESDHWHAAVLELQLEGVSTNGAKANGATAAPTEKPQEPVTGAVPMMEAAQADSVTTAEPAKPSRKSRIKAMVAQAKDALDGTSTEAPNPTEKPKRKRPAKAGTDAGSRSPRRP
jgi:hypothetical protein